MTAVLDSRASTPSRDRVRAEDVPEKFAERLEGELVVMSPVSRYHSSVAWRLGRLFKEF